MSDKHETKSELFERLIAEGMLGSFDWSGPVCKRIYDEIATHAIREFQANKDELKKELKKKGVFGEIKRFVYDHGGSRIFIEKDNARHLLADTYEPIEILLVNRSYLIHNVMLKKKKEYVKEEEIA